MAEIIPAREFEAGLDLENTPRAYQQFQREEGIPVHAGLYVEDWLDVETDDWARTGQSGAFVNLYGQDGCNDVQIHEISPNGQTDPQRHLHDEIVYVAAGNGLTIFEEGTDEELVFEWTRGSLFFLPPNTEYRHVNTGDAPVRLLAETMLPQLFAMYKHEAIFDGDADWWDEYRRDGLYAEEHAELRTFGTTEDVPARFRDTVYWTANFIPDMEQFDKLEANEDRGAGGKTVIFPMEDSSMHAHMSEFPPRRYKKAHRHHPGANVGLLRGEGYSLMWRAEWDERVRIDWAPRTLFTPPALWFHQHFNTGREPTRYFALHGSPLGTLAENGTFDSGLSANKIEYADEDPAIRELYEAELAATGIEPDMPEAAYADPEFAF